MIGILLSPFNFHLKSGFPSVWCAVLPFWDCSHSRVHSVSDISLIMLLISVCPSLVSIVLLQFLALLASRSAMSFPSIPMCDGIHSSVVLHCSWFSVVQWFRILFLMSGLLHYVPSPLIDCMADSESVAIATDLGGLFVRALSACSMAVISAVYMDVLSVSLNLAVVPYFGM